MEVAIFSDLHLGLKNDSQEWHEIAFQWVDSMVSTLKKKKITDIFFLGDWYHDRSSVSGITLAASAMILDKLQDFTLWIFPGNHDLYFANQTSVSSVSIFKGYPNVRYFDTLTKIDLDGHTITLAPWGVNPLDGEDSEYLLGHLEINTFKMSSASSQLCEDGLKASELLRKFKHIYSGHFHFRQSSVYSMGSVKYVGNPFQMNYGEVNEAKGFIILDLDTGTDTFIVNKISPTFQKILLSKLAATDIPKIQKTCKDNFVKILIDKNITVEDVNELTSLLHTCRPRECSVDWDNNGLGLDGTTSNLTFESLELMDAMFEYIKLLDIENQKEVFDYLRTKYKECASS